MLGNSSGAKTAETERTEKNTNAGVSKLLEEVRNGFQMGVSQFARLLAFIWSKAFAKIGEDWVFLALLGMLMAVVSFVVDSGIYMCNYGDSFKIFPYKFLTDVYFCDNQSSLLDVS